MLVEGVFYLDEYFSRKNEPNQRVFVIDVLNRIGYLMSLYFINENKMIKKETAKLIEKIIDKLLITFNYDLKKCSNIFFTKKDIAFFNQRCSIFQVSLCYIQLEVK